MAVFLRSLLFYAYICAIFLFFFPPFYFISLFFSHSHFSFWVLQFIARGTVWGFEKICGIRCKLLGLENLPNTPCLFASKHHSSIEILILWTALASRGLLFFPKRQLFSIPFFGPLLRKAGNIPVPSPKAPKKELIRFLREAEEAVQKSHSLLIFPEGTRVPVGPSQSYKRGTLLLYQKLQIPCVPVALDTGLLHGRKDFFYRPGTCHIQFLPPIPPGLPMEEFFEKLQQTIEEHSLKLLQKASPGKKEQQQD